ncbi:hypothetical protein [Halorhabdus amylolytica]|uniref:hypothetical protein n=1 Tax=Halorhabdus amylolytica TaxID=2559573 RepID=UPI00145A483C|nr:hypothetical protein [Halorhabdus amylolytica]
MSVIQSIKETIGLKEPRPTYRCAECGTEFQSSSDTDSHWFGCPECDSSDAELIEE